jgi:threonine/homoserine/homoserine lactone efflux protein
MDTQLFSYLWKGVLLGMHAGFAPGPVTTLLVTESLRHGRRVGMRIAFVPILTDLPVVALVIPLLYFLTFNTDAVIGIFSIIGSFLLGYLGYESLTVSQSQFERGNIPKISLLNAVGVNFFNPNLYIYWLAICGPICVTALQNNFESLFVFLSAFYISITLVKLNIALMIGTVRHNLNWNTMVWVNRLLGVAMILFAALFFWQGWQLLTGEKTITNSNIN